jgi:enterochelin esterase-like enzyme
MPFTELGPLHLPTFEPRPVWVYGPPGDDPAAVRPLLVILDGQNAYEYGPQGGWESHRAVDAWFERSPNAPRIVAVPHGHARADELCAWPTWNGGPGGRGFDFIHRLAEVVVPQVRARFATPAGSVGAAIAGASWGGNAALIAHFARPDVFGGALCLSPAFWVGGLAVFDWIASRPTPPVSRIWIDCGRRESGGRMFPMAERMVADLRRRGYADRALRWRPDEDGAHSEVSWRRRFPEALAFMYG